MALLKKDMIYLVVAWKLFVIARSSAFTGVHLKLTTDQPAVKSAPVGFSARLVGTNDTSASYTYTWKSIEAGIKKVVSNQTTVCNITVTVPRAGTFLMKVVVESDHEMIAKEVISFNITETINGKIKVSQPGLSPRKPNIVATNIEAVIEFALHDPHHFFNNSIFYGWFINGDRMETSEQSFKYNFTEAKNYDVTAIVSTMVMAPYYALSVMNLKARDPIQMLNISGQTSLNHGDLLDVEVACTGSAPYSYCWYFTQGEVNGSTEKCTDPSMTTSCDMIIIRYFQKAGNYKLVVIIDNDIDHKVTTYNINVFASAPEPQLSPIIVPLVCVCLALLIVVIGVMYYVQTRRNCSIEVADFDFQQSDMLEFHSFYERLRDSCKELCGGLRRRNEKVYTYRRMPAHVT